MNSGRFMMEMYISRSASLPISLRMDFGRAATNFNEVGDLYHSIAERISQLSIRNLEMGPNYLDLRHCSSCIKFPNLKSLVISCIAPNILFDFFEAIHAPDLQTVAISTFKDSPPQPWHPFYHHAPVDTLYMAYAALDPNINFQVPVSSVNSFKFSKVRDLGLIGTPRATTSQTLSDVVRHLAGIFPNAVSLYTDASIMTLHLSLAATRPLLWPCLHYISFYQHIPASASSTLTIALQEIRAREGRPIHNIHFTGTQQFHRPSAALVRAQDVRLDWW